MNNTKELYSLLTRSERLLICKSTKTPLYAIRLLLFLEINPNSTMEDLMQEFHMDNSAIHRAVNLYLPAYIKTTTTKQDGVKKPINRYSLTANGQYLLEDITGGQ